MGHRPEASARKAAFVPGVQQAFAAFQQGRDADCISMCEAILALRRREPAALHLLGAARLRRGEFEAAVHALSQAAEYDRRNAEVHANLGAALRAAGHLDAAIEALRRSVKLRPDAAPTQYNLGNALAQLGRYEDAVCAYRTVVTLDPAHSAAHNNLGIALNALGRRDEALAALHKSAALQPVQRDAHLNLARMLLESGAHGDGLHHMRLAVAAAPADADLHNELGVALLKRDRAEEAISALRTALACDTGHRAARVNLGSALCMAGRAAEGTAEFDAVLAAAPDDPDILSNLGAALDAVGSTARARETLGRALQIAPDHANALNNLGMVHSHEGQFELALDFYDRALAIAPDHSEAAFGRATTNLVLGRFRDGWRDYLFRPSMACAIGYHRARLPDSLAGAHVLVEGDQGLGDEIFFLRFVPRLRERGARVSYLPNPRLRDMLRRSALFDSVLTRGDAAGQMDFCVSVGDLPFLLGTDNETPLPYSIALPPLAERAGELQAQLAAFGPPPYRGLTWRAGTRGRRKALYKEVPGASLAKALRGISGTWVALQRNPDEGELAAISAALEAPLHDLTALNADLEGMLALLSALDGYVCVSNTNVHLRAACGKTCHVLVPHPPEFRWLTQGDESPWFPGTRVYRQPSDGDMKQPFDRLARDIVLGLGNEA